MASKRRMILQILAYTVYGLTICLGFVYLSFPYDLLRQRVVDWLAPDAMRLAIAELRPTFPLGVLLQQVRLQANTVEPREPVLHLRTLRVQPAWLPLFSREVQLRIAATLYDGHLQGDIHPPGFDDTTGWTFQGQVADLGLARHPWLRNAEGEAWLRGRLGGNVQMTLDQDGRVQEGELELRVQRLVLVAGQHPLVPLQQDVTCDTLQSKFKVTARQVQIVSLNCQGDDLTIQVRGSVQVRQPWNTSMLNLHVQMRSETTYKRELGLIGALVRRRPDRRGGLSFRIRGPVRKPRFGA